MKRQDKHLQIRGTTFSLAHLEEYKITVIKRIYWFLFRSLNVQLVKGLGLNLILYLISELALLEELLAAYYEYALVIVLQRRTGG